MQELLEKWERLGQGLSMMNRDAHYQALMAVEPAIIKYVAQVVDGMAIDDMKTFMLFGHSVHIRKVQNDAYTGRFLASNGDIVHYFDRTSIPQIAGQIQSYFELYAGEEEIQEHGSERASRNIRSKLEAYAKADGEGSLVEQLLSIFQGEKPKKPAREVEEARQAAEVKKIIDDAKKLTAEARAKRKSLDDKKELGELREKIEGVLARVESIVKASAPVRQEHDKTHALIADISKKHDTLVDRTQQELNILAERLKSHATEHSQGISAVKSELSTMISAMTTHMNSVRDQIMAAMPSGSNPDVDALKEKHDLLVDKTQEALNTLADKVSAIELSHSLHAAVQHSLADKIQAAIAATASMHHGDMQRVEEKHDLLVDKAEQALNALEDRIAEVTKKLQDVETSSKAPQREIIIKV